MKRIYRSLITGLLLAMTLASCEMVTAGMDAEIPAGDDLAQSGELDGIKALPCFKCHPYVNYTDGFPHDSHRDMGLHCTQCHALSNHNEAAISGETCNSCHSMGVMKMKSTAMAVNFDHGMHWSMFACGKCHDEIFPMKLDGKKLSMDEMYAGKYCGSCHDGQMAFSSKKCGKCHKNM